MTIEFNLRIASLVLAAVSALTPVMANEDTLTLEQLRAEVDRLGNEVSRLRVEVDTLNAIRPTVTTLMPAIAERFHVMHYAGDAEDWALAAHELTGIWHLVEIIRRVDPNTGALADGFLQPHFDRLEAAIEHGNRDEFSRALDSSVEACNACHVAVGSPTMRVALDAADSLSLRHSHVLAPTEKPGEHKHSH